MTDDKLTSEAIDTVASAVIAETLIAEIGEQWESYPEIGEHDWLAVQERVVARAKQIHPGKDSFAAAYDYLEGRAEKFTA